MLLRVSAAAGRVRASVLVPTWGFRPARGATSMPIASVVLSVLLMAGLLSHVATGAPAEPAAVPVSPQGTEVKPAASSPSPSAAADAAKAESPVTLESFLGSGGQERGRLRGEVSYSRQEAVAGAVVVLVRESDPGTLFAG